MSTPRARAAALLAEVLADGPRVAGYVERAGADAGVSIRTLRRAAVEIGVTRTRQGTTYVWRLPPETGTGGSTGTAPAGAAPSIPSSTGSGSLQPSEPSDDRQEITTMTTTETTPAYLLAIAPGLTWPGGKVLATGDVVAVPERGTLAWDATCDRHGTSFLDDLSPRAQVQRWNTVFLAATGAPEMADDDPAEVVQRRAPIVAPALSPVAGPRNYRLTPEGSTPFMAGLGGDGPVEIVADDRRDG